MSQINVNNLSFAYSGSYDYIFKDTSFIIDDSWKLGLIGRNGRGKTTFLKILQNKLPYEGSISLSLSMEYFPFEIKDASLMTIEIVDLMGFDYEYWKLKKELNLLKVDEDVLYRSFDSLSNGEQTKVMLAILFIKPNSFLLIDEPTDHLDQEGREILKQYLKDKSSFILVSHDRQFLDGCVDHILSINKSDIRVQSGNFSSWWNNKKMEDNYELAQNQKLTKEITKLQEAAKQSGNWADKVEGRKIGIDSKNQEKNIGLRAYLGEKSRRLQQRRKNLESRQEQAIKNKQALLKNIEKQESLKFRSLNFHKEQYVNAYELGLSFGERQIFKDLSFSIFKGDKVALLGKNGSGKSSLIKLIMGENISYQGEIKIGSGLKISYVPQNVGFLKGSLSHYAKEKCIDESLFLTILRKLDFDRVQFEKPMESYSQGQRKKVAIGASLCEKAHLYIWDEPLNYIDIISRIQIQELILEYQPTLVFVEHDIDFQESIATKTISL